MKTTTHKAFQTLAAHFRRLQRLGDSKKLSEFMASVVYHENYVALSGTDRERIQEHMLGAMASAAKHKPKLKPIPRYSDRGWRAWDDIRIAKLKAAERKTGTDEGIARALGISYNAAKAARRRYIGNRVEVVGGGLLRQAA